MPRFRRAVESNSPIECQTLQMIPPAILDDSRTDADLFAAFRSGDERGFAVLVHRHLSAVQRIAVRMLGLPFTHN